MVSHCLSNTTTIISMKPRCRKTRRVLPDELVHDILTRVLPSKTLARFQCVCKTWHSFISSPPFIHDPPLLVRMKVDGTMLCTDTYNSQGTLMINKFHYRSVSEHTRPIQAVRGLLCFVAGRDSYKDEILVCNPSTRELETLPPPPPRTIQEHMSRVSTGFGHIASTNEFKVVRFFLYYSYSEFKVAYSLQSQYRCQVLTLSTTSGCSGWREVATGPPYLPATMFQLPFVQGALHLLPDKSYHYEAPLDQPIVAFDVETEQYREVQLPHHYYIRTCRQHHRRKEQLAELQGYLCLAEQVEDHLALWLLKDYHDSRTWVKEYNIDITRVDSRPDCSWRAWPCAMLDDGRVLFVNRGKYGNNTLWCYDPRDDSFSVPIMCSDCTVTLYEERLLPPLRLMCARRHRNVRTAVRANYGTNKH